MTPHNFHWFPERDDRPARLAECTGWMALKSERRTVSVVLPVRDQLARLRELVPELSDALTENGQPWEILIMDQGSQDGTFAAARGWTSIAGFRLARSMNGCSRAAAIAAGLLRTRGDGVLVLDPALRHAADFVTRALLQWDDGARLIVANHGLMPQVLLGGAAAASTPGPASLPSTSPLAASARYLADFDISRDGMVLFDRGVLDDLLG